MKIVNLKFEKALQKIINDAVAQAKKTGVKQLVYAHLDGWFDFGADLPFGSALICEVAPTGAGAVKKPAPVGKWIRIDEGRWIDVSQFFSVELQPNGTQVICSNEKTSRPFACQKEIVESELERIRLSGHTSDVQIQINMDTAYVEGVLKNIDKRSRAHYPKPNLTGETDHETKRN